MSKIKNIIFDVGNVFLTWDPQAVINRFTDNTSLRSTMYENIFKNDNWDHLRERDGEMVRMELDIVGEGVEFDKWWNDQTLIIALDTGTEVFITHWDREHAQDFQAAMSAGEAVAVEADGVQIGQFSLSGAREAMIELKRCGADVLRGVKYN